MCMTAIMHTLYRVRIVIRQGNSYTDIGLFQINWKGRPVFKPVAFNQCQFPHQASFHAAIYSIRYFSYAPGAVFFNPVHGIAVSSAGNLPQVPFFICSDYKWVHIVLPLYGTAHHPADHHLLHCKIENKKRKHT